MCLCEPPIPSTPSRMGRTKEAPSASFLEPVLWIDSWMLVVWSRASYHDVDQRFVLFRLVRVPWKVSTSFGSSPARPRQWRCNQGCNASCCYPDLQCLRDSRDSNFSCLLSSWSKTQSLLDFFLGIYRGYEKQDLKENALKLMVPSLHIATSWIT